MSIGRTRAIALMHQEWSVQKTVSGKGAPPSRSAARACHGCIRTQIARTGSEGARQLRRGIPPEFHV